MEIILAILSNPVIIVGLIALLGHIAQKSDLSVSITGFLKTILGFMMLQAGAGIIIQALIPFSTMFTAAFNLTGVVAEDNSLVASVQNVLGYETTLILLFSFIVNLIIARFTRFKYIFLTGHMMLSFAGTMAILLKGMGLDSVSIIIIGSVIQGISMVVFPALAQPHVRKVVGSDDVAFGFFGSSPIWISALIGKLVGNTKYSTEDLKVPKSIGFLKDMAVLMSLIMIILFFITGIFTDNKTLADLSKSQSVPSFLIFQALNFVVGILILLQGVRMFLAEIVPAFQGIAQKIVHGARPALDVPIFYSYAPIAVTVGFITALLGGLLATFISQYLAVVVLPSPIGLFFMGGAAGVFGNSYGGRRGAIVSGFILGFLFTIMVALAYPLIDVSSYGIQGLWFASTDAIFVIIIVRLIGIVFGVSL